MPPIHTPFTMTLLILPKNSGVHSCKIRIAVFERNHLINGQPEYPLVISVLIAICLCRPIFPPSGVSIGSMKPHWEEFNKRGPTTFALASNGKFNFRN